MAETVELIAYRDLEGAPDDDLEWFIRSDLGLEPEACVFALRAVALGELEDFITSPLEEYLTDRNERAYTRSVELADVYDEDGAASLPPIVLWHDQAGWHMLDGFKRCAAAYHVGLASLPAYELIQPPANDTR